MLLALEGIAGAGKSTVRDRVLAAAKAENIPVGHVGQFSWLSLDATRTIIGLRTGHPSPDPMWAVDAVCRDLELHACFNLTPGLSLGPVIADRLILATACLLALLHRRPVDGCVRRLAEVTAPRPQLTVLLTTPPAVCHARLADRVTARRFAEDPHTAARLADLYQQAATAWTDFTGMPVLRRCCTTRQDIDLLIVACMDRLREAARATA